MPLRVVYNHKGKFRVIFSGLVILKIISIANMS